MQSLTVIGSRASLQHPEQRRSFDEAGIETLTLQKYLARGLQPDTGEKRLYVIDDSSLASTRQMHEFIERLRPNDRVLLVGDWRQHEAVEAGRPFAQLQDAGMKTVKLEEIVRQKDPELKEVVQQLARGNVREAIKISISRAGSTKFADMTSAFRPSRKSMRNLRRTR